MERPYQIILFVSAISAPLLACLLVLSDEDPPYPSFLRTVIDIASVVLLLFFIISGILILLYLLVRKNKNRT